MRKGDFTMIYFDNAATTRRKPQEVVQAVTEALCSLGNAGRGAHEATLQASRTIYDTRRKLAEFFHAENPAIREASGFCMAISSVLLKL